MRIIFPLIYLLLLSDLAKYTLAARKKAAKKAQPKKHNPPPKVNTPPPKVNAVPPQNNIKPNPVPPQPKKKVIIENPFSIQSLNKSELTPKKDWCKRLIKFEGKFVSYFKSLNQPNILIVGDNHFTDAFKKFSDKNKLPSNFIYTLTINENTSKQNPFIIDAKYEPQYFKTLYPKSTVVSFRNIYMEFLLENVFDKLKKKGVKFLLFEGPILSKIKNLTKDDLRYYKATPERIKYLTDERDVPFLGDLYFDNPESLEYMVKFYYYKTHGIDKGSYITNSDVDIEVLLQVINGTRRTYYLNEDNNTNIQNVYFYGDRIAYGTYVADHFTVESQVQQMVNKDNKYGNMINRGVNIDKDIVNDFERILYEPNLKKDDIIIDINEVDQNMEGIMKKFGLTVYETSELFNRPNKIGYWMITEPYHINHNGVKVISESIYKILKPLLRNKPPSLKKEEPVEDLGNSKDFFKRREEADFKDYLETIDEMKSKKNITGRIGSVILNYFPFTLGHRYLIEQALKTTDHLMVFIIEDDDADLYYDKFNLVQKGTAGLYRKVTLLPGKDILASLLTLRNKNPKIGLSADVITHISKFGKRICPLLGISSFYSAKKNDLIKKELAKYNIAFNEIPAKFLPNKQIISGVFVQNLINTRTKYKPDDLVEQFKKYIPISTIEYLKDKYKIEPKKYSEEYQKHLISQQNLEIIDITYQLADEEQFLKKVISKGKKDKIKEAQEGYELMQKEKELLVREKYIFEKE
ncbi:MAG: hypothetical protein MJ252_24920, partial [archaeon]|nr:hypothetical protein [archaeon]